MMDNLKVKNNSNTSLIIFNTHADGGGCCYSETAVFAF